MFSSVYFLPIYGSVCFTRSAKQTQHTSSPPPVPESWINSKLPTVPPFWAEPINSVSLLFILPHLRHIYSERILCNCCLGATSSSRPCSVNCRVTPFVRHHLHLSAPKVLFDDSTFTRFTILTLIETLICIILPGASLPLQRPSPCCLACPRSGGRRHRLTTIKMATARPKFLTPRVIRPFSREIGKRLFFAEFAASWQWPSSTFSANCSSGASASPWLRHSYSFFLLSLECYWYSRLCSHSTVFCPELTIFTAATSRARYVKQPS